MSTRALTPADEPLLWEMLRLAAHEESLQSVRDTPELSLYVNGWGRPHDFGYAAVNGTDAVGASWCRCWNEHGRGYGFVSESIPELAVAVLPNFRGQGIGTTLICEVLNYARHRYEGVSLSVRVGGPAERLYLRLGFAPHPDSDVPNRVGGLSRILMYRF